MNPPYLGARYAAANDLSAVIGTQLRQPQFLPFIAYRFQFGASTAMLAMRPSNPPPGAIAWQSPADGTITQEFSFEDAGNGLVYIRSHVSNRYLTATSATTLIHDLKYSSGGAGSQPPLQRWRLARAGIIVLDRDLYVIACEAYPGLVLQPANPGQGESPVVLGDPGGAGGPHHRQKLWKVTSPLIGDTVVTTL